MNNLEITASSKGEVCRLTLVGEATIYQAVELKERLVQELSGCHQLELDLAQVHEIDTAGLQILLLLQRHCQQNSKTFELVRPSRQVHNLISLFGLDAYFLTPQPEPPNELAADSQEARQ